MKGKRADPGAVSLPEPSVGRIRCDPFARASVDMSARGHRLEGCRSSWITELIKAIGTIESSLLDNTYLTPS